jgi:hypothetical protein
MVEKLKRDYEANKDRITSLEGQIRKMSAEKTEIVGAGRENVDRVAALNEQNSVLKQGMS